MEKLLLTPVEAAALLSVSRSKLYELLASGRLCAVRIDGCRRLSVSELHRYVAHLASNAGTPESGGPVR